MYLLSLRFEQICSASMFARFLRRSAQRQTSTLHITRAVHFAEHINFHHFDEFIRFSLVRRE